MASKRFIDLSISIEPGLPSDPPMMIPKIDYVGHAQGAEQMKDFFPGVRKDQLPGGMGWALEFLTLTTQHNHSNESDIKIKGNAMTESKVREFYTGQVRNEWRRLVKDAYHRLDFETTMHFLQKYLPTNGLVLDAGCGPGRYSIELAKRGYQVVMLDLTPANLEFARRQVRRAKVKDNIKSIVEGSIVDLSRFPDTLSMPSPAWAVRCHT